MKRYILLMTLLLTGCATQKVIEVPVYHCPEPNLPNRPELSILKINKNSSGRDVMILYGESIDQLLSYSISLESLLKAYSKQATQLKNSEINLKDDK